MSDEAILDPPLSAFLLAELPARPAAIAALEDEAARTDFPIIGPLVGRLCETVARMVSARRVLELGSGFGYSAYWWSRAMPRGGQLVWTDGDAENEVRARALHAAVFPHLDVDYRCGDALEVARDLPDASFDVVFSDVDKHQYPAALALARKKVRPGGAIVFDNVLWSRRIFPAGDRDASTEGVRELLALFRAAGDLVTSIVPIRDGVSISIRT